MKLFEKFRKDKSEFENNAFDKHGFIKSKDSKKKVYVTVNGVEYQFDFETNTIYEISSEQIRFAICIRNEKRYLFNVNLYIKIDYLLITSQMPLKPYVSRLFGISCFGRCS